MSASATIGKELALMDWDHRRRWRWIRLDIIGLASGANTIAHGLLSQQQGSATIQKEEVLLTSAVAVHRTQAADSTNLYYTVDSGAGTTMSVWVIV
ncbi:MAG TPA: hypothetical protein VKO18_10665 [Terriglobia bacterium]|nr:hypothetical protein [Terriglobia bacterium]